MIAVVVVLPNCQLWARKLTHPEGRDTHGQPMPADRGVPFGPLPGSAIEQTDQGLWSLRADPMFWPLRAGDVLQDTADGSGRAWVVSTALLHENPAASDVDYIAVVAALEPPEVV